MTNNVLNKYTYEVFEDVNENWHWKIFSIDKDLILSSKNGTPYKKVCEANLKQALTIHNHILTIYYTDKNGKYRCRLENITGETIAVSESYNFKTTCERVISSFYRNLPNFV